MRALIVFCFAGFAVMAQSGGEAWRNQGIIDVTHSPHVKLHSVPVRAVHIGDGFWAARIRTNVERSIPTMLEELEQHGVMDNFRRLTGTKQATRKGPVYTDLDIFKWIEAAGQGCGPPWTV